MASLTVPSKVVAAAVTAVASEEPSYYVFYSRIPNSTIIFPDGTSAGFVGGRYTTKDAYKASLLQDAIAAGNQSLYIDVDKPMLTEAELDPMAEYNARIIAEYLASQISANKESDKGNSTQGRLNITDTKSVGAAAASSDSGAQ